MKTIRPIKSVKTLDNFGRIRLSKSFFMRDFLYSEISNITGIQNIPDNPNLAVKAGTKLCEEILEPLHDVFGRIVIRSAFRSCAVNQFGNENKLGCSRNESNYAAHIWDRLDKNGNMGAMATIIIPSFYDRFSKEGDWVKLAWWIHDNINYSSMYFFPKYFAFNIAWHEVPKKSINSYAIPDKKLTDLSMENNQGDHSQKYQDLLNAFNLNK